MTVVVYHSTYGCDTGCCGHTIEVGGREGWTFGHPDVDEDPIAFAKALVAEKFPAEHLTDLDWANAEIRVVDH